MKRVLLIIIVATTLFSVCGCVKREETPQYVIEDVKKYMANEYNVEIIDYLLITSKDEVKKYGIGSPYKENDDMYYYHFRTSEFDFDAYSTVTAGAISYRNQDINTNISAVVYKKNMDSIKKIAQKYNIKIEDNLNLESLSIENELILDFNYKSQEIIEAFSKEMLEITDIEKLIELKYDKFEKEDGTISFSVSGYDENMIRDYSLVEGYYNTQFYSKNSLLAILACEYYK